MKEPYLDIYFLFNILMIIFFYFTDSFETMSNIATFKPMKKRRDNFYSLAFLRLKHTNFFTRFRYIVKTNIVGVVL